MGKTKEELRNVKISFAVNEHLQQIVKVVNCCGAVSVERKTIDDNNSASFSGIHMMSVKPALIRDVDTSTSVRDIAFLEDDSFLLTKSSPWSLELWDSNCSKLSSMSLPGSPYGIEMITPTEGMVAIYDEALLSFKVFDNVILEVEKINVPVLHDLTYHKGKYYIGSRHKIIVNDNFHQRVCDIDVEGNVYYITARDDDTLWYTLTSGKELNCITTDGSPVFKYSHHKLQGTRGVTVDCFGNIYVCCYDTMSVHQLSLDKKLKRIMSYMVSHLIKEGIKLLLWEIVVC